MAGPWEKFQRQPRKPWERFQKSASAAKGDQWQAPDVNALDVAGHMVEQVSQGSGEVLTGIGRMNDSPAGRVASLLPGSIPDPFGVHARMTGAAGEYLKEKSGAVRDFVGQTAGALTSALGFGDDTAEDVYQRTHAPSEDMRRSLQENVITGDITKPSTVSLGTNPTFYGMATNVGGTLARMAPVIAAARINPVLGAAAGVTQSYEGSRAEESDRIDQLPREQVIAMPRFRELVEEETGLPFDQGYASIAAASARLFDNAGTEEDKAAADAGARALQRLKDEAGHSAGLWAAPLGVLQGFIFTGKVGGALASKFRGASTGILGGIRAGAGTAVGMGAAGLGESATEVGQKVAQAYGATTATGEQGRNLTEDTAADAILGFGPGALTNVSIPERQSVTERVFGGPGIQAGDVLGDVGNDSAPIKAEKGPMTPGGRGYTFDEAGNVIEERAGLALPPPDPVAPAPGTDIGPAGPREGADPVDFIVDPEGGPSASGDWRSRAEARRARSGGPGMGPAVDGEPTMAPEDMAQAAFDTAMETAKSAMGRAPSKSSANALASRIAERFGVDPAALIERNRNPVRTQVSPAGGVQPAQQPEIGNEEAGQVGTDGQGQEGQGQALLTPSAAVAAPAAAVAPASPAVEPAPPAEVPRGRMFRQGNNAEAVQAPNGTWYTRRRVAGRWQPWQRRRSFDPSGAHGYSPYQPPSGNVRTPAGVIRVGDDRREAKPTGPRPPSDIIQVIAAAGGINREAARRAGVDPAMLQRRVGIRPLFPINGGMPLNGMRELLTSEGFFPPDDPDAPPTVSDDDAFEIFNRALQGERIVSPNLAAEEAAYQASQRDAGRAPAETDQPTAETQTDDDERLAAEFLSRVESDPVASRIFGDFSAEEDAEAMEIVELAERAIQLGATPAEVRQAYNAQGDAELARNLWELIRTKEIANGPVAREGQARDRNGDQAQPGGAETARNAAQRQPAAGNEGASAPRPVEPVGQAESEEVARLRARIAELEAAQGANEVTGLPGKARFEADAALGWSTVSAIDMDGLGRLNDATSHEAANAVLRALADQMRSAEADGVRFYHLHGDELAARFRSPDDAARIMRAMQDELAQVQVPLLVTLANGTVRAYSYDGIGISFGLGANYDTADAAAIVSKREREAAGLRQNKNQPGAPRQLRDLAADSERREGDGGANRYEPGRGSDAEGNAAVTQPAEPLALTDNTIATPPTEERPASQGGLFGNVTAMDVDRLNYERAQSEARTDPSRAPRPPASDTVDIEQQIAREAQAAPRPQNTIFTEDAAARAREILRRNLGRTSNMLDPEVVQAGLTLAGYHIEAGARRFADFVRAMVADLGEEVRPYLKSWYMAAKYDPRVSASPFASELSGAAEVESANVEAIGADDVSSANINLERDRGNTVDQASAVEAAVPNVERSASSGTGSDRESSGTRGRGRARSSRVSADGSAVDGNSGNLALFGGERVDQPALVPAGADNDPRGGGFGDAGIPVESAAASEAARPADQGAPEFRKRAEQRAADGVAIKVGDLANIRETLPYLLPGQQEDVHKAEQRFAKPDGYGMLFTNGTGTGKTFTGLGIVKRFARQGKTNTIIVAPSDKIIEDWINSGKALGLNITRLDGTNDAGNGIVITTYAAFGANRILADRDWDLVVADEAHYLAQDKDGTPTTFLRTLRAITLHPDGAYDRARMIHRDLADRASAAADRAKLGRMSDDERNWSGAGTDQEESDRLYKELRAKTDAMREYVASRQGIGRTRATFLSATPFAYEKAIDWANGYLFDYNEGQESDAGRMGYNSGDNRERFFMLNFGYRMRYNKLTQPDANVDTGVMQRQFNAKLKRDGSLSSRILDVAADYDRKFILTESAIGARIDAALQWIRDHDSDKAYDLQKLISDRFDHLSRRYLLEAIKAEEVIPLIREHMALGRKVVVFHDYKKGGGFNPFDIPHTNDKLLDSLIDEFRAEFRDLVNYPFQSMPSPIIAFQREFPGVLLFNGDVSPKDRRANVAKFNDDASGPQVILVQSAAGKEGISLHDTTGKHQRVLFNLGLPTQPTTAIQQEGRIYRTGQVTNALFRYLNTGTNWERWAFATTIATRSSTAENLALGEQARALRDAFIAGFEESDNYRAGDEGEGIGGKERDRAANEALTEFDRARSFYFGTQKKNSRTKAQEGTDYFATPEPLGLKMVEWADIRPGETALEPSAGHGAIARWFPETNKVTAIEPSAELAARLAMVRGDQNTRIEQARFEDHNIVNKYDVIVMNPPFGSGGRTAIDHLDKAARHLRDGGRIVALIPTGPAADAKFQKWFFESSERAAKPLAKHPTLGPIFRGDTVAGRDDRGSYEFVVESQSSASGAAILRAAGSPFAVVITTVTGISPGPRTESYNAAAGLHLTADIELPAVTFERAGTQVRTRVLVIDKIGDGANPGQSSRDYTDATTIKEFFDRIENATIPARTKPRVQPEEAPPAAPAPREERAQARAQAKDEKKSAALAGEKVATDAGEAIVEHVTQKGKTLRGVVRNIGQSEAKALDAYTFRKNGGFFIRLENLAPKDGMASVPGWESVDVDTDRLPDEAIEREVAKARAEFGDAVTIEVMDSINDSPASDRTKQLYPGANGLTDGKSNVWIFRKALQGLQALRTTLAHEIIGHIGVERVIGADWPAVMDAIKRIREGKLFASPAVVNAIRSAESRYPGADDTTFAREAVAIMAERGITGALWDRIVAAVRRYLRKVFGSLQWSESEVRDLLRRAGEAARKPAVFKGAEFEAAQVSGDQRDITETPEFKRWFGDSKVVDADGKPLVVYHGTTADVDAFDLGYFGSDGVAYSAPAIFATTDKNLASDYALNKFDRVISDAMRAMQKFKNENNGVYDDRYESLYKAVGESFKRVIAEQRPELGGGANVIPAYMALQNPLVVDAGGKHFMQAMPAAIADAIAQGNDGLIVNDVIDHASPATHYPAQVFIAFRPEQIKSVNNRGTFDPNDPNILARNPAQGPIERQMADDARAGQPIDKLFRLPFHLFGLDSHGRLKPGTKLYDWLTRVVAEKMPAEDGAFGWAIPIIKSVRSGLIDRYGVPQDFVQRDERRESEVRSVLMHAARVAADLEGLTTAEAKVLQAMLTGQEMPVGELGKLSQPIKEAIDQMGREAVELGLISPEAYERNRGAYLHRSYLKYEADRTPLGKAIGSFLDKRRKKLLGDTLRRRGMTMERDTGALAAALGGSVREGDTVTVLRQKTEAGGVRTKYQRGPLNGPAPVGWENLGDWRVMGFDGKKAKLWRDFTPAEREKMGEILDARYNITKTFALMAHDLATGRFLRDIAANQDWARADLPEGATAAEARGRYDHYADADWVRVPDAAIPGTNDGKGNPVKRWGALAGMYVRAPIWRDLNQLREMQNPQVWGSVWNKVLTFWKTNKTARNPVVHVNNVMSNMMFMDLADIRLRDLYRAIGAWRRGESDDDYRDAMANGAFGGGFADQELKRKVLQPILDDILAKQKTDGQDTAEDRLGVLHLLSTIWDGIKKVDGKMLDAYNAEDEIFRLAFYLRRQSLGDTPEEAARAARRQFIDYDIRAPWVNAARNTVLPFIGYTYRSIPILAQAIAERPWKLAKYATLAAAANWLGYLFAPGDEDDERKVMAPAVQGNTWTGTPRMIRMPWYDADGNPVFLDVRRWIPAGDVFDMNQSEIGLPAWLQFGGPLQIAGELMLNKQAFTKQPIVDPLTDTTGEKAAKLASWGWKAFAPNAPWIPESYSWDKIIQAFTGETDELGRDYSGVEATASVLGIKAAGMDVDLQRRYRAREFDRVERELDFDLTSLKREYQRKKISQPRFKAAESRIYEKKRALAEERRRVLSRTSKPTD